MQHHISTPRPGDAGSTRSGDDVTPATPSGEPTHLFSNDPRTREMADPATGSADDDPPTGDQHLGLLLMIATIGTPILGYCVYAAM